jgi:hypothetical protein
MLALTTDIAVYGNHHMDGFIPEAKNRIKVCGHIRLFALSAAGDNSIGR